LIRMKSELTIREICNLLKSLRKLKRMTASAPPKKKSRLWESVKKQAQAELIKDLKSREKGLTLSPNGPYRVSSKPTESEEKSQQDRINYVIEGKSEKKYRTQDPRYNSKLKQREVKAKKLVARIDHTITALKVDFAKLPETNKTMLSADWKELTSTISLKGIMKFSEEGGLDRTIDVLKIIKCRLKVQRHHKIWTCFLQLYEKTLGVIVTAFLEWWAERFRQS